MTLIAIDQCGRGGLNELPAAVSGVIVRSRGRLPCAHTIHDDYWGSRAMLMNAAAGGVPRTFWAPEGSPEKSPGVYYCLRHSEPPTRWQDRRLCAELSLNSMLMSMRVLLYSVLLDICMVSLCRGSRPEKLISEGTSSGLGFCPYHSVHGLRFQLLCRIKTFNFLSFFAISSFPFARKAEVDTARLGGEYAMHEAADPTTMRLQPNKGLWRATNGWAEGLAPVSTPSLKQTQPPVQ